MKRIVYVLLFMLPLVSDSYGQEFKKPGAGKSLVYFVRFSGTGSLINFKYFDGDEYLGKMSGVNYFIYECDPGEHLFWVAAENRDYLKANLKPDATYLIEVRPTMGAFKAAVQIHPIAPGDEKTLKKVNKIIAKEGPAVPKGQEEDESFLIKNSMERYEKIKNEVPTINPDWTF